MDAKGWAKCKGPRKMFNEAKGKVSDRQLRLFACALVPLRLHKMEPIHRLQVIGVERYLDGEKRERARASKPPRGDGPGAGVARPRLHLPQRL